MKRENILGYDVVAADPIDIVEHVINGVRKGTRGQWLACLNPHSYVCALDDPQFSKALRTADFLVADGIGVVMASRMLGAKVMTRVTGSDIFEGVNKALDGIGGCSVFFLGSTVECLADIKACFERDYPNVRFAGSYSPPFKPDWSQAELEDMRRVVNAANADVLWVGMTAPKQEKWLLENLPKLDVKFAAAIGAVFDFYTGRVQRSSPLFQRLGLEWLPRLVQQPQRLWRRMFISAPLFLWHTVRQRAKLILL